MNKEITYIVKGVSILLMLWHHVFWTDDTNHLLQGIGYLGKTCVVSFILLSSYGLFSKEVSNYRGYLSKRLGKFIASYWFVVFFTVMLFLLVYILGVDNSIFFNGMNKIGFIARMFLVISGMQYLIGYKGFLSPWWYVTFSMIIYLLYPFVKKIYVGSKIRYFILMTTIIFISFTGLFYETSSPIIELMGYFSVFMFGLVCADKEVYKKLNCQLGVINIGLLLLFSALRANIMKMNVATMWLEVVIAILLISSVKFIFEKQPNNFSKDVLLALGRHSGNMFLFHMAIKQLISLIYVKGEINGIILFIIMTVLSFVCSLLFEYIKEKLQWNQFVQTRLDKCICCIRWQSE